MYSESATAIVRPQRNSAYVAADCQKGPPKCGSRRGRSLKRTPLTLTSCITKKNDNDYCRRSDRIRFSVQILVCVINCNIN